MRKRRAVLFQKSEKIVASVSSQEGFRPAPSAPQRCSLVAVRQEPVWTGGSVPPPLRPFDNSGNN